jgi:hypothetical protein
MKILLAFIALHTCLLKSIKHPVFGQIFYGQNSSDCGNYFFSLPTPLSASIEKKSAAQQNPEKIPTRIPEFSCFSISLHEMYNTIT